MKISTVKINQNILFEPPREKNTKTAAAEHPQIKEFRPPFYVPGFCANDRQFKKSKLVSFDYAAAEIFKPDFTKMKSKEDFDAWVNSELNKKLDLEQYKISKRIGLLQRWKEYITEENDLIKNEPSLKLLIFSSIVKNIKDDNTEYTPQFNANVLAQTIDKLREKLDTNKKQPIDFKTEYEYTLRHNAMVSESENTAENETKWIVIPSGKKDKENFEKNVDRLNILSCKSWCTKSSRNTAKSYLSKGDFHIYLKNGKPKIGIRYDENEIQEIQGEKNNKVIPIEYLDMIKEYTKGEKLSSIVEAEFYTSEEIERELQILQKEYKDDIAKGDYRRIFEHFGMEPSENDDGTLNLSHFQEPDDYSFSDLGINEYDMMKNVVEIEGNAYFWGSSLKSLDNLEKIGGDACFEDSEIEDSGELVEIGGDANFSYSKVKNLGKLKKIGGFANFRNSKIKSLGELEEIGMGADFGDSEVEDLGRLKLIAMFLNCKNSKLTKKDFANVELRASYCSS